jgi:hypothetical protein
MNVKDRYINPFTDYRDLKNVIDTGWEEGREAGRRELEEGPLGASPLYKRILAEGVPL